MALTVIAGPPERSRTSSPRWNKGAVRFCVAVTAGAGSEKAGIDKGTLSAAASVSAAALGAHFVKVGMLKLHSLGLQFATQSPWDRALKKGGHPAAFFQIRLAA
jgi:hypothetical protein